MAIEQFNPVYRPIVNTVDLEKIGKAYDTLEQGHQATIAQASTVKQELAKLDLNEEEDAWRQQQINKIESTIKDNSQYGNAYSAFDDVIAEAGNIMSNPGMLGRLRAQQNYKEYINRIDNSNLNEEYKTIFKELNPYHYRDKIDEKGKVIGGTKWKPNKEFVNEVPLSGALNQALQWVAKESGSSNQTRWLDANDNVTDDITKSVTGEIYSTTTNSWQKVTKEKLAEGVRAVIESNPALKASLEQDYYIAKYKYNKNGYNPDIVDKNGVVLTPEEYLNKRIDPFYNAATYYNQTNSTEYGNAWKAQLELSRKKAAASGVGNAVYNKNLDSMITTSNVIVTDNDFPIEAQGAITSSKQEFANLIKATNPEANFSLDGKTRDELLEYVKQIAPENQAQAIGLINTIIDNEEYLNQLKEEMTPEDADKFDAYNTIISMGDLKDDDYGIKENYSNIVNKTFGDAKAIRQYFANEDSINEFINQIGGIDKLNNLGIKQGVGKNGKKYFQLNRNNIKSLYSFAKAAINTYNITHDFLGKAWSEIKNYYDVEGGDNLMFINNNNEESTNINLTTNLGNQPNDSFYGITSFVDSLKTISDRVLNGDKLINSVEYIPAGNPRIVELQMQFQNGELKPSDYKALVEIEEDKIKNSLRGIDFSQKKVFAVDDDNRYTEIVDTEERKKLNGKVINAKNSDITVGTTLSDGTNTPSPIITIASDDDNKQQRYIVVNGFESETVNAWKNDTNFIATNDLNKYRAANRNLSVTDNYGFAGVANIQLIPVGNNIWNLVNKDNNTVMAQIDNKTAKDIRTNYLNWKQTYDYVKSGRADITMPGVQAMINKTAKYYASLMGGSNDLYTYYLSRLTNNLINN